MMMDHDDHDDDDDDGDDLSLWCFRIDDRLLS